MHAVLVSREGDFGFVQESGGSHAAIRKPAGSASCGLFFLMLSS